MSRTGEPNYLAKLITAFNDAGRMDELRRFFRIEQEARQRFEAYRQEVHAILEWHLWFHLNRFPVREESAWLASKYQQAIVNLTNYRPTQSDLYPKAPGVDKMVATQTITKVPGGARDEVVIQMEYKLCADQRPERASSQSSSGVGSSTEGACWSPDSGQ